MVVDGFQDYFVLFLCHFIEIFASESSESHDLDFFCFDLIRDREVDIWNVS